MRILTITEYYPDKPDCTTGGVESLCFHVSTGLAKRGHSVIVVCTHQRSQDRIQMIEGVQVFRVGPTQGYTSQGNLLARNIFAFVAARTAKKIGGDILHGTNFLSYVPAGKASVALEVPSIATYNEVWLGKWKNIKPGLTGIWGEYWEHKGLRQPWRHIIAISEYTRVQLMKQAVPADKISVIHPGVNLDEVHPAHIKALHPTIICVSRLVPSKDIDTLIKAVALVKLDYPNIQCVIIGDGPERQHLECLTRDLNVNFNVRFLGRLPSNKSVLRSVAQSHIFCLPSRVEGFGISVIEAMACGIPVVLSDIPPFKEILHNGKGGFHFPVGNVSLAAQHIVKLLNDHTLYDQKMNEAIIRSKSFSWHRTVQKVEELILETYVNE